ncbi:MAG TPA: hypothetical protein VFA33_07705 [Bryobacteraceae bacterium]|nr:hypothetical protein [Bryobacteraceae bacterium]
MASTKVGGEGTFDAQAHGVINTNFAALDASAADLDARVAALEAYGHLLVASVTLSAEDLLALNDTPVVLVAAAPANCVNVLEGAVLDYQPGETAYTIGDATNLTINYKADASGAAVTAALSVTGLLDQATEQIRHLKPLADTLTLATAAGGALALSPGAHARRRGCRGRRWHAVGAGVVSPVQPGGVMTSTVDFIRAAELTLEVAEAIDDAFAYHPWDPEQTSHGVEVRKALAQAVKVIVAHVPPCPDRSTAIRKLREARMDCNSAITHRGRF